MSLVSSVLGLVLALFIGALFGRHGVRLPGPPQPAARPPVVQSQPDGIASAAGEVRRLREAHDRLLRRVYPLHDAAAQWQDVPFERYQVILVTGPQRSGTTWAACALASQLGYTLLDERHPITGGNNTLRALQRTFAYLRSRNMSAVVQSPMGTKDLHLLPSWPGLLVAFMARNCLDVFLSQNKVDRREGGWTCSAGRTRELRKYLNRPDLRPHFDEKDMICKVKQDVWQSYQEPLLRRHAAERIAEYGELNLSATVDFASFRSHPLWLRGEQRTGLRIKSTNCALVKATPRRSRNATRLWVEESDAALAATITADDAAKQNYSQTFQPRYGRGRRCLNCVW